MEQKQARERGLKAHVAFYDESRRIAAASATKGRCFIATLALGECDDTRALRAFRDLYLRRSACGRWLVGTYYATSPALCGWLEARPPAIKPLRWLLRGLAREAGAAVRL
ncbi:MAG: CFI-box-CTERM domain-containing protein [Burkholderiaceae bacterium]|nr:CFI-box-CTERM domain-containing protein [Burkholderiaceae bacterium]